MNSERKIARAHLWVFTAALTAPGAVMLFTEPAPLLWRIASFLFGTGFFSLLMLQGRRPGRTFWWLFLFVFFGAFNLVLLSLYGNSPISVDMFLNVVSTNSGEAIELLGNIIVAVTVVCGFYIAALSLAAASWWKGRSLDDRWRGHVKRRFALPVFAAGTMLCAGLQVCTVCQEAGENRAVSGENRASFSEPDALSGRQVASSVDAALSDRDAGGSGLRFHFTVDVYPANVTYNLGMAVYRYCQLMRYPRASRDFKFHAEPTHDESEEETYIVVVGETARNLNFSLYGYKRKTNPRLERREGLNVYRNVLSQSNTTHKSVPLLLTAAEAAEPAAMYREKSVIAAFREAGFYTIFISNQADGSGLVDHYSREAHRRLYIREEGRQPDDADLLAVLRSELQGAKSRKRLVVLHTYGSHFKYRDRVPDTYSLFTPCEDMQLEPKNRDDLVNAYDNTILYTDMVLDSIMSIADGFGSAFVVYTSDHGEDLYDDERLNFLHASPVVDYYQLAVPFMVWMNDAYRGRHPEEAGRADRNVEAAVAPGRDLFHTMLGAAGVDTPFYRADHALTDSLFCPGERLFLNDRNEACRPDHLHLSVMDVQQMRGQGVKE